MTDSYLCSPVNQVNGFICQWFPINRLLLFLRERVNLMIDA